MDIPPRKNGSPASHQRIPESRPFRVLLPRPPASIGASLAALRVILPPPGSAPDGAFSFGPAGGAPSAASPTGSSGSSSLHSAGPDPVEEVAVGRPRFRMPKPAVPILRCDRNGARVRQAELEAATAGRTWLDDECMFRVILVLLTDPRIRELLDLLREILCSWNAVGDVLLLARPLPHVRGRSRLSQHMSNDPVLQNIEREAAIAQLEERAGDPALAAADLRIRDQLVQRLHQLTDGINPMAQLPVHQLQDWPDDFALAAAGCSVADLHACQRRLGITAMARALGLPSAFSISCVLLCNGRWRRTHAARVAALHAAQQAGRVERPERVALLRQRLTALVAGNACQDGERAERRSPRIKAEQDQDVLFEAQQLDHALLAGRPEGGSWLDNIEPGTARLADRSWRHFERSELLPDKMAAEPRAALRRELESALPALVRPSAQDVADRAARFELVTTLDDDQERGMGLVSRLALARFTPLFFYGGTVCVGAEATQAYQDTHPQAWRYAMDVGWKARDVGAGRGAAAPPVAVCFGFPVGNLGPRINARRLNGSDEQRRQAANVLAMFVQLPDLPFGLALLVTRAAVAAGEELFLDYGGSFGGMVQRSLAPLPRWPMVKQEPHERQPARLETFLDRLRAQVPGADGSADPSSERSPAASPGGQESGDGVAWMRALGCELRQVAPGPDSFLHALESHRLGIALEQQLRHDIADAIARTPDTPESLQSNRQQVARLLGGTGLVAAPVTNALYAELARVPGQRGGKAEIRAWCRLEDERRRARRAPAGPARRRTRVALLTQEGTLWLLRASASQRIDLGSLPQAERDARLLHALRQADVALLREGDQYSEILWSDEAEG